MMNTELKQTIFQLEKLKNVVNVGGSSAYQIFTYPGVTVGRFGAIIDAEQQSPANDANFNAMNRVNTGSQASTSWVRQALSAILGQE